MKQFERWSLLIIGEALLREVSRCSDFERNLLIDRSTLDARLAGLVSAGLMDRRFSSEVGGSDDDGPYFVLTDKGRDLESVVVELDAWSERWSLTVPTPADITMPSSSADDEQPSASIPSDAPTTRIELQLLGSFRLRVGGHEIPGLQMGAQRLLAFLALRNRPVSRTAVASQMWPDSSHERAGVSLRSALARLDPATRDAINIASAGIALADAVTVDLHEGQKLAHRLLRGEGDVRSVDLQSAAMETLTAELLPDWRDDWLAGDCDDWRQLRTTALEAMSQLLLDREEPLEAARAARAAIKVDLLRETGHAALIRAHLSHGNRSLALRAHENYRSMLHDALHIDPSPEFTDLVRDLRAS